MSDNIDKNLFLKIIYDFCACIIEEDAKEDIFIELSKDDKAFCDKYYSTFDCLHNDDFFSFDVEFVVRDVCTKSFTKSNTRKEAPFSFYNEEYLKDHLEGFEAYCKKTHNVEFPTGFRLVTKLISLQCKEVQNISLLLNEQIQVSNEINENKITEGLDSVTTAIGEAKTKVNDLSGELKDVTAKAEKKMTETGITILGIFSAIVLTINAALTFSSSVLDNINKASIYRISLVSLILGLVVFSILICLFNYLNDVRNGKKKHKKLIGSLIISDIVIILLMIGVCYFWWTGLVEERNNKINTPTSTSSISETISSDTNK